MGRPVGSKNRVAEALEELEPVKAEPVAEIPIVLDPWTLTISVPTDSCWYANETGLRRALSDYFGGTIEVK